MRKHIFLILGESISIGVGIVISVLFRDQLLLWLGIAFIVIGVLGIIVTLLRNRLIKMLKTIKITIRNIKRVVKNLGYILRILDKIDEQKKNPEEWLYPVIHYINLNMQSAGESISGDVKVQFQIDSGLLYPISEYYLSIKLGLAIQRKCKQIYSGWYKITPINPFLTPIRAFERNGIGNKYDKDNKIYEGIDWGKYVDDTYIIHLGLTDEAKEKNKTLLKWIEEFRKEREGKECFAFNSEEQELAGVGGIIQNGDITTMPYQKGDKLLAMLIVGISFKNEDEEPTPLKSQWIVPANNYSGG